MEISRRIEFNLKDEPFKSLLEDNFISYEISKDIDNQIMKIVLKRHYININLCIEYCFPAFDYIDIIMENIYNKLCELISIRPENNP